MVRGDVVAAAAFSLCLVACAAAGDPGMGVPDGGDPSTSIDVHGRVVGPTGVALAGMTVGIGEKSTVTADDGRFDLPGVVPPYDLQVVLAGTALNVVRYEGLTRTDPTIGFLTLFSTGEPNTATIGGTVSGAEPIGTAGVFTTAFFTSDDVRFDLTSIGITSRNNPFTLPISWFGPEAISGTVHVLQFATEFPGVPPTAYTGYGTHPAVSIARDGAVVGADVTLSGPGNAAIDGTIVPPDGFRVLAKTLGLEIAGTSLPLGHLETPGTDFAFTVPANIPATASVTVNAQSDVGGSSSRRLSGIPPGSTGITLTLPAPSRLLSPEDGATVGAGTDFTWIPPEHAVHLLALSGGPDDPLLFIVSGASTVRLPQLPAGSTYHWFVAALGPHDGIDAFAGGASFFPALGESFQAISTTRSFVVR